MKQVVRILVAALFASAVWTSSAQAVEGWFVVDLVMSGAQDAGDVYVNLTDRAGSFTGKWFRVADPVKNQALAIALTAVATDSRIFVRADPDAFAFSGLVLKIFIVK